MTQFQKLTPHQLELLFEANREFAHKPEPITNLGFLSSLAAVDRGLRDALMAEVACEPGDIIFKEGETGDSVYLIRAGQIAAIKGEFESPVLLGRRGPGEVIGEMALLDSQPRSASVIALEKMRLLRIDAAAFDQLIRHNPDASKGIMTSLSARLREATQVRDETEQFGRKLSDQVTTLRSEKRQLLELQRVRQETSSLIVHDLRNPLGLLYGAVQMLEFVLPEEVVEANRELFEVVNTSYGRMRRLVDSLLDVARMETREVPLYLTTANVQKLVDDATGPFSFAVGQRHIEFSSSIADGLPDLVVDEEKIVRVLGNLIDNALKYMPTGGKLDLSARLSDNAVQVSVADTGPGIPAHERKRVFERFAQVAGGRRPHGFGLGLAFCRLTVEAHGGQIWVEPGDEGIGSRFVFTLPLPLDVITGIPESRA
jgi:signal transduction histidine kinase